MLLLLKLSLTLLAVGFLAALIVFRIEETNNLHQMRSWVVSVIRACATLVLLGFAGIGALIMWCLWSL